MLCAVLQLTELEDVLDTDEYTMFFPTNDAFSSLEQIIVSSSSDAGGGDLSTKVVLDNVETLTNLLWFHTIANRTVYSTDFNCTAGQNLMEMTNGFDSRTLCENGFPNRQKGASNTDGVNMPNILLSDVEACNGILHVVNHVLLDPTFRDIKPLPPLPKPP